MSDHRCHNCSALLSDCDCWMNPIVRDEREPPWKECFPERADLEPKELPDGRWSVAA